jgi:hypothetical protein
MKITKNNTELASLAPQTFGKSCTCFWKHASSWKKTLQGYTMNGTHKLREECKDKLTPICPKYIYRQTHNQQQLVKYSVSTGPPWLVCIIADSKHPNDSSRLSASRRSTFNTQGGIPLNFCHLAGLWQFLRKLPMLSATGNMIQQTAPHHPLQTTCARRITCFFTPFIL